MNNYLSEKNHGWEFREKLKEAIFDSQNLKTIKIDWPYLKKDFRTLASTANNLEPQEIAMAFFERGYLCFGTSLYWNQITNQIPRNYYIATERKSPVSKGRNTNLDELSVMDEFMKPPRETKKTGILGTRKFTLIERENSNYLGVVIRNYITAGRKIAVHYTDVERTLIDCATRPDRCGGVVNVIESYRKSARRINVEKLIGYYMALKFRYPYWQRVGVILKFAKLTNKEKFWREKFGSPESMFYLDHKYKTTWPIDDDWKVACPPGINQ